MNFYRIAEYKHYIYVEPVVVAPFDIIHNTELVLKSTSLV